MPTAFGFSQELALRDDDFIAVDNRPHFLCGVTEDPAGDIVLDAIKSDAGNIVLDAIESDAGDKK